MGLGLSALIVIFSPGMGGFSAMAQVAPENIRSAAPASVGAVMAINGLSWTPLTPASMVPQAFSRLMPQAAAQTNRNSLTATPGAYALPSPPAAVLESEAILKGAPASLMTPAGGRRTTTGERLDAVSERVGAAMRRGSDGGARDVLNETFDLKVQAGTEGASPLVFEGLGKKVPALAAAIPDDWREVLAAEISKPYFQRLDKFVAIERQKHEVLPAQEDVFNALQRTSLSKVKVVILGQDPYPAPGQAMGLSFSVPDGVKIPGSLKNIFSVLHKDMGVAVPKSGNLTPWADQGVLLLNTILTVRAGQPNSHRGQGWEQFTEAILKKVNDQKQPVVFLLMGSVAQKMESLIDASRHAIIKTRHPSPQNPGNPFGRSRPFSKVNAALRAAGRGEIDWALPAKPSHARGTRPISGGSDAEALEAGLPKLGFGGTSLSDEKQEVLRKAFRTYAYKVAEFGKSIGMEPDQMKTAFFQVVKYREETSGPAPVKFGIYSIEIYPHQFATVPSVAAAKAEVNLTTGQLNLIPPARPALVSGVPEMRLQLRDILAQAKDKLIGFLMRPQVPRQGFTVKEVVVFDDQYVLVTVERQSQVSVVKALIEERFPEMAGMVLVEKARIFSTSMRIPGRSSAGRPGAMPPISGGSYSDSDTPETALPAREYADAVPAEHQALLEKLFLADASPVAGATEGVQTPRVMPETAPDPALFSLSASLTPLPNSPVNDKVEDNLKGVWKVVGAVIPGILLMSLGGEFTLFWAAIAGGLLIMVSVINVITRAAGPKNHQSGKFQSSARRR